jgi:hypothetical protein
MTKKMTKPPEKDEEFNKVVKQLLSTPPQPKIKKEKKKGKDQ